MKGDLRSELLRALEERRFPGVLRRRIVNVLEPVIDAAIDKEAHALRNNLGIRISELQLDLYDANNRIAELEAR